MYLATVTDECVIEARPSDTFHIVYENYETLVIVRIIKLYSMREFFFF